MTCSMSRKVNCWDDVPTESWFNSFQNERGHGKRFETRQDCVVRERQRRWRGTTHQ
jgi:putative transposase